MTWAPRRLILPAVLALLLDACQPLPHPFDHDRPSAALIAVPDNFNIAVTRVDGNPPATAEKLPKAIAQELVKHNITASDETASKASYQLAGRIETRPDQPGQSVVTVYWQLRDPYGNIVSERSDRLAAPTREWDNGDEARVTQLAAAGAAGLAALMTDATPKEAPGGGRVRVAVRKIDGAPGDGNASLANSLTAVLKHADIELVDAANGKPDVDIDCNVKLDSLPGGQQHVKIVWYVNRAAGGEVGEVAQENDIPRGRLDGPWGDIAYSVAMAAADGIMQVVDRAVPAQRRSAGAAAALSDAPTANAATPASMDAAASAPSGPPVAGNIDSPEVNLPPVNIGPADMPKPLGAPPDVPVPLPYRGVPISH
ncbi:MAG TPA: hypothetical protein VK432_11125 [Stellaceae bacterium]|nr:hypothetical protein [Stellaceae bacterium]